MLLVSSRMVNGLTARPPFLRGPTSIDTRFNSCQLDRGELYNVVVDMLLCTYQRPSMVDVHDNNDDVIAQSRRIYFCKVVFSLFYLFIMSTKQQPLSVPATALTPNFLPKDYGVFFLAGALCCTL